MPTKVLGVQSRQICKLACLGSVGDTSPTRRGHVADLILHHEVFVETVLGHLDKVSMLVKTVSDVSATRRRRCKDIQDVSPT